LNDFYEFRIDGFVDQMGAIRWDWAGDT